MKYLIVLSVLIISCNSTSSSLEDDRAAVMKIHDDAMAKMGEVRNAAMALEELLETNPDSSEIKSIISNLETAEEGMMVWMEKYKEPEQDLKSFYASEKNKIQRVADDINKSLTNAKKYMVK